MKTILTIIVFGLFQLPTVFAQNDTAQVDRNKNKIGQLNQRLDKLLEDAKTIDADSVQYKLDQLFQEVQSIKENLTELRESVGALNEEVNFKKSGTEVEDKITELQTGKYYMVLASKRDLVQLEMVKNKMSDRNLLVVRNSRDTWYHLVLNEAMSMREAIEQTTAERKTGVEDAWWVTAKKIKLD